MFKRFLRRILGKVLRIIGLHPDVQPLLAASVKLTNPLAAAFPAENLPFASRVVATGMWNYCFFQFYRHFAGPYWVERQYNPSDPSFIPRASSMLSVNLTHRTWMGLRSPNGLQFSMVDPAGSLSPIVGDYSVELAVKSRGKFLLATRGQLNAKQKLFKHLPIPRTEYSGKFGEITWTVAGCNDYPDWVYSRIEYNLNEPTEVTIGIRPFNPEGAALIHDLQMAMNPGGSVLKINKKDEIFFLKAPDEMRFSELEAGDAYFQTEPHGEIHCKHGIATGALIYRLAGQGTIHFYARNSPKSMGEIPLRFVKPDHEISQTISAWEDILSKGAQFQSARGSWNRAARVFSSFVVSLQTGSEVWPGMFTYNQFWFRDAAYMISALTSWGYLEQAKKVLLSYPSRQFKDGFFKSHEGEWDSNGQAIWTLAHYVEHTNDRELLNTVYPSIKKGANWITKKRRQGPEKKILPAGFSAEHLGPADHYYWDNLWSIAGLLAASRMAALQGDSEDEKFFLEEAESYRRDLLQISAKDRAKFGLLTAAPGRPVDSGMIGSVCVLYPLDLMILPEQEVRKTMRILHKEFFERDLFFHPIIHSGFNLYLSMQTAQAFLQLGDVRRARRIFKRVLKSKSDLWTYPEALHPNTGGGVMGDGFHGWAFAEVMHLLRSFLIRQEGSVLNIFQGLRNKEVLGELKFGPFPMKKGKVVIQGSLDKRGGHLSITYDGDRFRRYRIHVPGLRKKLVKVTAEGCDSAVLNEKRGTIDIDGPGQSVQIELKCR